MCDPFSVDDGGGDDIKNTTSKEIYFEPVLCINNKIMSIPFAVALVPKGPLVSEMQRYDVVGGSGRYR